MIHLCLVELRSYTNQFVTLIFVCYARKKETEMVYLPSKIRDNSSLTKFLE